MSQKTPLVLLPAFMASRTLWSPQIEALSDIAEIQVVELTPYDSVAAMAEAVLKQAPERFALAGLSLGGFTAFEILRHAPERVTRLALVSTSARADAPERRAARGAQVEAVQAGKFDDVVEGFLQVLQSPTHAWSPEVLPTVRQMVPEAGAECFVRQQHAMKNRVDSRNGLEEVSCPTIVIHGKDDQSWPLENAEELARLITGARLTVIENCGHFLTLDQPEPTNAALRDWLIN